MDDVAALIDQRFLLVSEKSMLGALLARRPEGGIVLAGPERAKHAARATVVDAALVDINARIRALRSPPPAPADDEGYEEPQEHPSGRWSPPPALQDLRR